MKKTAHALHVLEITSAAGEVIAPVEFAKAERVHRQLRPGLPADYLGKMRRVFAGGGRYCVALEDGEVAGVAVYRIHENTADGVKMYVDDLVTDETRRSGGVGKALMDYLQEVARKAGCECYTLDSGTFRQQAHKFYFREGMVITSFCFKKPL